MIHSFHLTFGSSKVALAGGILSNISMEIADSVLKFCDRDKEESVTNISFFFSANFSWSFKLKGAVVHTKGRTVTVRQLTQLSAQFWSRFGRFSFKSWFIINPGLFHASLHNRISLKLLSKTQ